MSEELKPCPFCGETPDLPSGDGTYYVIECRECGGAVVGIQISDLMTIEERQSDPFTDYRYAEQFIERAKAKAAERWNTRATPPAAQVQGEREGFEAWQRSGGFKRPDDPGEWEAWQARAALSAPPAAGVPEGYRLYLIPKEDTDAFHAACSAANDAFLGGVGPCGVFIAGYRAMLATSPTPPASEQQQAVVQEVIEQCAKLCEERRDYYNGGDDDGPDSCRGGACQNCADVIRYRMRLNPHLAGVNQGVTEAGNGGEA